MITEVSLIEIAKTTRQAAQKSAVLSTQAKNQAIEAVAQVLEKATPKIIAANQLDCRIAETDGIAKPLYNRLKMDEAKLKNAIAGLRNVATLRDPIGVVQIHRELDTGLILKRITCSLGVIAVVFEARPDAVIQISALAIKSGNGVILKGGKEATNSCLELVTAIHQGLSTTSVNPDGVQLLTTREETLELLKLDKYVDLIIPRGSNSFVKFVQENTQIPVLGHAEGICHVYVDKFADIQKAVKITIDAKTQYPAACNAAETLLVHADVAAKFLPEVFPEMEKRQVELRGDRATQQILSSVKEAIDVDWATEYSDLVLSVKIVDSLDSAIAHINNYGSGHTDAIITEDGKAAEIFFAQIASAGVFHNCSTRFSDGFRYGFGAEVGISTQKMAPRGPVGLEGLVTYKYQILGDGHIAATYTGENAKPFTHQDF